eukprot:3320718-Lingulodinium_polyedra.AAC.1
MEVMPWNARRYNAGQSLRCGGLPGKGGHHHGAMSTLPRRVTTRILSPGTNTWPLTVNQNQ